MAETVEIHYDPSDPRSVDARRQIVAVLVPLARAYATGLAGGEVPRGMRQFNRRFNRLLDALRDDPVRLSIVLLELFLATNRGVGALATITGRTADEALRAVIE